MMKTNSQNEPATQGAAAPQIDVKTIEGYLKKDLSIALNCLDAIYRDQELLRYMAEFMHGRFTNELNRQQNEKAAQPAEQ